LGEAHSTREGAAAKAAQIARELAEESENYRGYTVIVIDADGKEIDSVSITETE
jgi:hypothetical protein